MRAQAYPRLRYESHSPSSSTFATARNLSFQFEDGSSISNSICGVTLASTWQCAGAPSTASLKLALDTCAGASTVSEKSALPSAVHRVTASTSRDDAWMLNEIVVKTIAAKREKNAALL